MTASTGEQDLLADHLPAPAGQTPSPWIRAAWIRVPRVRAAGVRRFLGFGMVGVSGFLPNLAVMWLCTDLLRLHYTLSAVVAHQVANSWNFALTDRLVFRDRGPDRRLRRYGWFMLSGNADLVVRVPFLMVLVSVARVNPLAGSMVVIGAMFLVRFLVTDRLIYRDGVATSEA
ncbi:GtrA family protein [Acrocarpospora catenulata]|uniref:GtrA family protein n=1 Tax=Acrocarpospora catenulata TaxID=2836182 RepID=UPI001BDB1ADA|nr:GtrA family protein [Acrocarpospora catenulata]